MINDLTNTLNANRCVTGSVYIHIIVWSFTLYIIQCTCLYIVYSIQPCICSFMKFWFVLCKRRKTFIVTSYPCNYIYVDTWWERKWLLINTAAIHLQLPLQWLQTKLYSVQLCVLWPTSHSSTVGKGNICLHLSVSNMHWLVSVITHMHVV